MTTTKNNKPKKINKNLDKSPKNIYVYLPCIKIYTYSLPDAYQRGTKCPINSFPICCAKYLFLFLFFSNIQLLIQ